MAGSPRGTASDLPARRVVEAAQQLPASAISAPSPVFGHAILGGLFASLSPSTLGNAEAETSDSDEAGRSGEDDFFPTIDPRVSSLGAASLEATRTRTGQASIMQDVVDAMGSPSSSKPGFAVTYRASSRHGSNFSMQYQPGGPPASDAAAATIVRRWVDRQADAFPKNSGRGGRGGARGFGIVSALLVATALSLAVGGGVVLSDLDGKLEASVDGISLGVGSSPEELKAMSTLCKQGLDLFVASAAILICVAVSMTAWGSQSVKDLNTFTDLLSRFGGPISPATATELGRRRSSSFQKVQELEESFSRLSHAVERFACFVPKEVVMRIVSGDPRAARLHVDQREVTIMFSDIKDYTTISERLGNHPRELLLVLTRYFTVMTSIIDAYEGNVGEILGDGILAFWNTPTDVNRHAAKACMAAVSQHLAARLLSADFEAFGLPQLKLRIGLHTGKVLSGNIGTFSKMKFGCIGDPVNLASRLEGLCKTYGVKTICSASTYSRLLPNDGLFCRRLDVVQVKGKTQSTEIFEVIGHDAENGVLRGRFGSIRRAERGDQASMRTGDLADLETGDAGAELPTAGGSPVSSVVPRPALEVAQEAFGEALGRGFLDSGATSFPALSPSPRSRHSSASSEVRDGITEERRVCAALYEAALEELDGKCPREAGAILEELLKRRPNDAAASFLLARAPSAAEPSAPAASGPAAVSVTAGPAAPAPAAAAAAN